MDWKCILGIHDWEYTKYNRRFCTRCKKKQKGKTNYASDLDGNEYFWKK